MEKIFLSFLIVFVSTSALAEVWSGNSRDLRQNVGWFTGTKMDVRNTGMYTAVNRISLPNKRSCSSVMITRKLALTAAHCLLEGVYDWQQDLGETWGEAIPVKEVFIARDYTGGDSEYLPQEDWGLIVLEKEVPKGVAILELARADEVYIGQPALSVGYPELIGNTEQRVVGSACTVRRLKGDNILTDCYIARGMSGGPLLVKTRSGQWKIAGIASEQYIYEGDYMVYDDQYTDKLSNVFVNVTKYRARIFSDKTGK